MPEKKEVRKTKPMARDPTIAEEDESRGNAGSLKWWKLCFGKKYRF